MSKVLQNIKATISLGTVEFFFFFCCMLCCTSMEATVLSCLFSLGMVRHAQSSLKQQITNIFGKGHVILFFASSHLHLVSYPLKLQKYVILGWNCQAYSLSANQIVRCFKLKKLIKDMRYQVDFFLSLKLEEILY